MTPGMADPEPVARVVRDWLGPEVGVACIGSQDGSEADLWPAERAATRGMVAARCREFAAGRLALRQAAGARGLSPFAVPMGADRAPVWPEGVIGSLTHSTAACLAVVGERRRLVSVGVDLEADLPLPDAIADEICGRADRGANLGVRAGLGERFALMVFVAKEAVYKCQYPLTGSLFGFDILSVRLMPEADAFVARFEAPVGVFAAGETLRGRIAHVGGHVVAAAWVEAAHWARLQQGTLATTGERRQVAHG